MSSPALEIHRNKIAFRAASASARQARLDALEIGEAVFDCAVVQGAIDDGGDAVRKARNSVRQLWASQIHRSSLKHQSAFDSQSFVNYSDKGAIVITLMIQRVS